VEPTNREQQNKNCRMRFGWGRRQSSLKEARIIVAKQKENDSNSANE